MLALSQKGNLRKSDIPQSYTLNLRSLVKFGIFERVVLGEYVLNYEVLKRASYVVPDEVFLQFADPDYAFEIKRQAGVYRLDHEKQKAKWHKRDVLKRERRKQAKFEKRDGMQLSEVLFPNEMGKRQKKNRS